jgi:DNA-binding MarR family transcriptional regulator
VGRPSFEAAVSDFGHAVGLLVRRVRAAAASHDLSWSESAVLARLDRDGPATTADLARAEGITPQSMGTIVAALEAASVVERRPHPTDGRQMHVALTAKGIAVRKSRQKAKETWLGQAIAQLDKDDQATLFAATEIVKRLVEL